MSKLFYQYVDTTLLTGALAATTVLGTDTVIDSSRSRGFRITKAEIHAIASYSGGADDQEGPIYWGFAHALSDAEIEEALKADPQRPDDIPAAEQSMRSIFPCGIIDFKDAGGKNVRITHEDGLMKKFNWSVPEGTDWRLWIYNMNAGALTTGSAIRVMQKIYGVWLDD